MSGDVEVSEVYQTMIGSFEHRKAALGFDVKFENEPPTRFSVVDHWQGKIFEYVRADVPADLSDTGTWQSKWDAIEAWNRRADTEAEQGLERIGELEELARNLWHLCEAKSGNPEDAVEVRRWMENARELRDRMRELGLEVPNA